MCSIEAQNIDRISREETNLLLYNLRYMAFRIGINPRPASASRALLRLTPCHRTYRRPTQGGTSGTSDSLELTGGEYKARERIHRGVADPRLLAIPASWRRIAASNPNWGRFMRICSGSRHCVLLYRPLYHECSPGYQRDMLIWRHPHLPLP